MKYLLFVSFFLLSYSLSAQKVALDTIELKNNKKVIIYLNKTWEYYSESNKSNSTKNNEPTSLLNTQPKTTSTSRSVTNQKKTTSYSNTYSSSSSNSSYVGVCGARTKSGGSCKRRVRGGGRCWQH